MDVRTAFLNEELNKKIYMDQPLGFKTKDESAKLASLKDLYMVLSKLLDNRTSISSNYP
jgi:hypothetical protein